MMKKNINSLLLAALFSLLACVGIYASQPNKITFTSNKSEEKVIAEDLDFELFMSIHANDASRIKEIIQRKKIDINQQTEEADAPLLLACALNKADAALALIEAGANIDISSHNGNTPLHLACYNDNQTLTSALVKKNAKLNCKNNAKLTPLYIACCAKQSTACALTLIEHGADIETKDEKGHTPLYAGCYLNNTKLVEALLKKGADMYAYSKNGFCPLHLACCRHNATLIELFCKKKDVDFNKSMQGITPLSLLATTSAKKENVRALRAMINAGAKVNERSMNGATALFTASIENRTAFIKVLLQAKADPNLSNIKGVLPLSFAIENNNTQAALELLKAGATVNTHLLSLAAKKHQNEPLIKALIKNTDVNGQDNDGRTALHAACVYNNTVAIHALLEAKANINAEDKEGLTPLAMAIKFSSPGAMLLLTKNNAYAEGKKITFAHASKMAKILNPDGRTLETALATVINQTKSSSPSLSSTSKKNKKTKKKPKSSQSQVHQRICSSQSSSSFSGASSSSSSSSSIKSTNSPSNELKIKKELPKEEKKLVRQTNNCTTSGSSASSSTTAYQSNNESSMYDMTIDAMDEIDDSWTEVRNPYIERLYKSAETGLRMGGRWITGHAVRRMLPNNERTSTLLAQLNQDGILNNESPKPRDIPMQDILQVLNTKKAEKTNNTNRDSYTDGTLTVIAAKDKTVITAYWNK